MPRTTIGAGSVVVEDVTADEGRAMVEKAAQERFGISWDEFHAAYRAGTYVGTDEARTAEELAFLAPFAG